MSAPIPTLAPNFDQRVVREIQRSAQPLSRYARMFFVAYALVSIVASAVVMRGQGLHWGAIAVALLASLAVIPALRWTGRPRLQQGGLTK